MKLARFKYHLIAIITLLINACQVPDVEPIIIENGDINTIAIPAGFDFSTHHDVKINIIDNADYAKYDVFAFSSEPYLFGTETYENQSISPSIHRIANALLWGWKANHRG